MRRTMAPRAAPRSWPRNPGRPAPALWWRENFQAPRRPKSTSDSQRWPKQAHAFLERPRCRSLFREYSQQPGIATNPDLPLECASFYRVHAKSVPLWVRLEIERLEIELQNGAGGSRLALPSGRYQRTPGSQYGDRYDRQRGSGSRFPS